MTDPNVGFSIYISDRERERIELERRKQAGKATSSVTPVAPTTLLAAPPTTAKDDIKAMKDSSRELLDSTPIEPEKTPTNEELFQNQISLPIVSVSNVTSDDTPWKAKYISELAAAQRSICDHCGSCDGYVPAIKTPGMCASCSCDLIYHLKSIDLETKDPESTDTDEEEWEDDEDGEDDDDGSDHWDDDDDEDGDGDEGNRLETEGMEVDLESHKGYLDGDSDDGGEEEE